VKAESWLCREIVQRNLEAPSIFAVMALQDWFSMDDNLRYPNPDAERINVPANPNHYWGYRMHVTLEDLMAQDEFNEFLAELFVRTQRAK
jgi:4-alpha-glucanotransferase